MELFILAGQSNMAGRGCTSELPPHYAIDDSDEGVFTFHLSLFHIHLYPQLRICTPNK